VKGKKEIEKWFDNRSYTGAELTWEPEFVDISSSGDLGYTYGYYQFKAIGKDGKPILDSGIFHTVWKLQPDGSWKFVWD
jgi:ketosteroid isomerase-like protein